MRKTILFQLLLPFALTAQSVTVSSPLRFLALGDSYTIGQGVGANERWPVQLSDSLTLRGITTNTIRIIATTGWRTDDLLTAISGQNLVDGSYNLVSLLIGVNNQYQSKPFSQYISEFPALLDSAIRYAGGNKKHVFVVSIPDYAYTPFGQQSTDPGQISAQIDQYNQYSKRVSDSLGIAYFDITPISRMGLQNPAYVAPDDLHPSGTQYAQWVSLMLKDIGEELLTGIQNNSRDALNPVVWPNPVKEKMNIVFTGNNLQELSIEIYSAGGNLVAQIKSTDFTPGISTAGLANGFYTIKISDGKKSFYQKLIKASD